MQLTRNFSLNEFIASQHRNIDNDLPPNLEPFAVETCDMLERIRALLSHIRGRPVPINISSGYRCFELNTVVGGRPNSDHLMASAADWTAPAFGTPYEICTVLKDHVEELAIGQVIHEFGRWVHTSTRIPDKLVNRIITISKKGTFVGIHTV